MSILDLIPDAERAEAVHWAMMNEPDPTLTPRDIALAWCVLKLAGTLTPTEGEDAAAKVCEKLEAEIAGLRELLEQERLATKAAMLGKLETGAHLAFASQRLEVYSRFAAVARAWVSHYGTADQADAALQAALHDTTRELDAIAVEERKTIVR